MIKKIETVIVIFNEKAYFFRVYINPIILFVSGFPVFFAISVVGTFPSPLKSTDKITTIYYREGFYIVQRGVDWRE